MDLHYFYTTDSCARHEPRISSVEASRNRGSQQRPTNWESTALVTFKNAQIFSLDEQGHWVPINHRHLLFGLVKTGPDATQHCPIPFSSRLSPVATSFYVVAICQYRDHPNKHDVKTVSLYLFYHPPTNILKSRYNLFRTLAVVTNPYAVRR